MKRERGYKKLEKAATMVGWLAVVIVLILGVMAIVDVSAIEKDYFGYAERSAFPVLLPYVAYIFMVALVGYIVYQTMMHFARMEIIALDGPDAFEPEPEPEPAAEGPVG